MLDDDKTVPLSFLFVIIKPLASVCNSTDDLTRSANERGDFCCCCCCLLLLLLLLRLFGTTIGTTVLLLCDGEEIMIGGAPSSPIILSLILMGADNGDDCGASDDGPSDGLV